MNVQRITISVPETVYTLLTRQVASGNVSQYVSETVHRRLIEDVMKKKTKQDAVEEFLHVRETTRKQSAKRILSAIHKGRQVGA